MKKYMVVRIYEPDFGCEERQPGEKKIDEVILWDEDKKEIIIQAEDEWLDKKEVTVGDILFVHRNKIVDLDHWLNACLSYNKTTEDGKALAEAMEKDAFHGIDTLLLMRTMQRTIEQEKVEQTQEIQGGETIRFADFEKVFEEKKQTLEQVSWWRLWLNYFITLGRLEWQQLWAEVDDANTGRATYEKSL